MFFGTNFLGPISFGPNALDTFSVHHRQPNVAAPYKMIWFVSNKVLRFEKIKSKVEEKKFEDNFGN